MNASCMCPHQPPRAAYLRGLHWAAAFGLGLAVIGAAHAAADYAVVGATDVSRRVEIAGHRAAWATTANDRGPVPADFVLDHLTVQLKRTAQRQQAFDAFLRAQQDPASPDYRHWLSPREIGARFGASQHDIEAVSDWLSAQGLRVDRVSNDRQRIRFGGTAANVGAAFATAIHAYATRDGARIANSGPPRIPAALAGAVQSVAGLATLRFRPLHRMRGASGVWPHGAPRPALTDCQQMPCSHVIFPADFASIYDLGPVQQAGVDGSGQTIAILARERVYGPDIQNFQDLAGLPSRMPTVIVPPQGTDPGPPASTCNDSTTVTPNCSHPDDAVADQGEATLDVQRAGSIAPGATIDLIASANAGSVDGIYVAMDYAIDTDPVPAHVLSISYATCEADNSQAVADGLDGYFSQAAMEGISVFVASGDGGVAGCASLDSAPVPGERLSANILCASSHVTCVGGTEFADSADPGRYWSASNSDTYGSALGYIPEGAWNDPIDDTGATQVAASGGGASVFIPTPSWQTGIGVPAARLGRYTPDVSFAASTREGYFTCIAAQGGSCVVSSRGQFQFLLSGGTSATAPDMAGIAALLEQRTGSAQANLNPRLYALAADSANGVFHDTTPASSGVADCQASVPSLCNNSTPGPHGLGGGLPGYLVGSGYDEVTGLGSIDVANLLAQWDDAGAAGVNLNQRGLTGSWADPGAEGQGLVLETDPDFYGAGSGLLFGGWFNYDTTPNGGQRWYTIQGQVSAANPTSTMSIYLTQGGRFASPQATSTEPIGQVTIRFGDCMHGTMQYSFADGSGRSGTMPLTRLDSNVTCGTGGDSGAAGSNYLLSGAWADPATEGQGLVFDINPPQQNLFAAWYTYAADAAPGGGPPAQRWYTLQAIIAPGASSVADIGIYDTTGGVFERPTPVTTRPVGTASLVFHSCTSATLAYHFTSGANSGLDGTLDLARIGPTPAGCQL